MRKIIIICWIITFPAHAEIFKCPDKAGKILYQPSPCQSSSGQEVLNINVDNSPRALLAAEEHNFFPNLMSGDKKATDTLLRITETVKDGDTDALLKAINEYWHERWVDLERKEKNRADSIQRYSDNMEKTRQRRIAEEQLRLQREANQIAEELQREANQIAQDRLSVERRRELHESFRW